MTLRSPETRQGDEPSEGGRGRLSGLLVAFASRLVEWVRRTQARRSPRTERLMLVAAVALFGAVLWFALTNVPDIDRPVRWTWLVAAGLIAVPISTFLNALEYRVSGKILGHRIGLGDSIRVSVLASTANRLPIPGAALVRIGALRRLGSGYGKATTATAIAGLAWIGTSFGVAGALQFAPGRWELGTVLVAGAAVTLALAYALMRWRSRAPSTTRLMGELLLIELGAVLAPTIKSYVVLHALGFPVSITQAAALAVSIVVAHATGFFPGGLGLRELVAGAMSPLVGLPVSVGLLATAASRVFSLIASLGMALAVFLHYRRTRPAPEHPEDAIGPPVPHDE